MRRHILIFAVANQQYVGRRCHALPTIALFANFSEKCYKDGGPRTMAEQAQCLNRWFKHSIRSPIAEVDNLTFSPTQP
jgi:hypothetical protein